MKEDFYLKKFVMKNKTYNSDRNLKTNKKKFLLVFRFQILKINMYTHTHTYTREYRYTYI